MTVRRWSATDLRARRNRHSKGRPQGTSQASTEPVGASDWGQLGLFSCTVRLVAWVASLGSDVRLAPARQPSSWEL